LHRRKLPNRWLYRHSFVTLAKPQIRYTDVSFIAFVHVSLSHREFPGELETVKAPVVWRDRLGSDTALANDDTPGVGSDDYDRWKENYGQIAGAGSTAFDNLPVPEPSTLVLLMLAVGGWRFRRGRAAYQIPETHQRVIPVNNGPS
jgi:hypothetical protein